MQIIVQASAAAAVLLVTAVGVALVVALAVAGVYSMVRRLVCGPGPDPP